MSHLFGFGLQGQHISPASLHPLCEHFVARWTKSTASLSRVCLRLSSWLDMPRTPPQRNIQEAVLVLLTRQTALFSWDLSSFSPSFTQLSKMKVNLVSGTSEAMCDIETWWFRGWAEPVQVCSQIFPLSSPLFSNSLPVYLLTTQNGLFLSIIPWSFLPLSVLCLNIFSVSFLHCKEIKISSL